MCVCVLSAECWQDLLLCCHNDPFIRRTIRLCVYGCAGPSMHLCVWFCRPLSLRDPISLSVQNNKRWRPEGTDTNGQTDRQLEDKQTDRGTHTHSFVIQVSTHYTHLIFNQNLSIQWKLVYLLPYHCPNTGVSYTLTLHWKGGSAFTAIYFPWTLGNHPLVASVCVLYLLYMHPTLIQLQQNMVKFLDYKHQRREVWEWWRQERNESKAVK